MNDAQQLAVLGNGERRAAGFGDAVGNCSCGGNGFRAARANPGDHGIDRAFADGLTVEIDAADARLRGEGNERRMQRRHIAPAYAVFLLRQHDDGAAFRRFIGQRGELRGVGQIAFVDAGQGQKFSRLTIAQRDRAGFVEQQRVHVARRFHRAARHGQHVETHQPVHARNADGGQQRADRRGDQRHEQRHQHQHAQCAARIQREARNRRDREDENDRHAREQNVERDLVGRFLPLRAFDQRNHAVEEGRALRRGDLHLDPIGNDLRAARHRRTVAAGFANDGRGFARDRGFVDGRHALDHVAVAGHEIARFHEHDIAGLQLMRRHGAPVRAAFFEQFGGRFGFGFAQGCGLRLAAPFGDGFREIREQHREPEPQIDLERKRVMASAREKIAQEQNRGQRRHDLHHEHHGIARHLARIELLERIQDRRKQDRRIRHRGGGHAIAVFCGVHGICL